MTGGEVDSTSANNSAMIAGHILTLDHQVVEGVEVNAYSDEVAYHASFDTDASGTFAFPDLEIYRDYMVEASKSGNYNNGVSTLDLVIIQRHILGLKTLDSPYKVIAADANSSSSISATDLVLLRRLILGITEELPNTEAWKFIDAGQEFENPNNPFPFREQIEYYNLQSNEMATDFVAVKIGDVNNTANANQLRSTEVRAGSKSLIIKTPLSTGGEILMLPFYPEASGSLEGMQFTLDLGRSLTYKGISQKQINVSESNIGLHSDHQLTFSWNTSDNAVQIDEDIPLFYLILDAGQHDKTVVNQLQLNSAITNAEIYTSENEVFDLELEIDLAGSKAIASKTEFKLYQNVPNPFSDETSIKFELPQAEPVTFRLIDITGKVVMSQTKTYDQGQNEIVVNVKDINAQGVLYYQLETKSNIANMKMIVLK